MADRGISARQLAARTGMSHAYSIKMMAGLCNPPSNRFIRKITQTLDLDLDHLLWHAGRITVAARGSGELTPRDVETILAFVKRKREERKRARGRKK